MKFLRWLLPLLIIPIIAGAATTDFNALTVLADTPATNDNSRKVATTAYVKSNLAGVLPLTAPTAWTPTDQSGAGLSLTNTGSMWYQVGKLCIVLLTVQYPATGSGANAVIGNMPCQANNTPLGNSVTSLALVTGIGTPTYMQVLPGSTNLALVSTLSGAPITNAVVTGAHVRTQVIFFTN